jgi:hypothetical protein
VDNLRFKELPISYCKPGWEIIIQTKFTLKQTSLLFKHIAGDVVTFLNEVNVYGNLPNCDEQPRSQRLADSVKGQKANSISDQF